MNSFIHRCIISASLILLSAMTCHGKNYTMFTEVPLTIEERNTLIQLVDKKIQKGIATKKDLKTQAICYYRNAATDFTPKKVEKAVEVLTELSKKYRKDYEIMAFHGAAIGMSIAFVPPKDLGQIMRLAKISNRKQDRAVKMAPNHLGVRLTRAYSGYFAPKVAGRTHLSIKDFKSVLELIGDELGPAYNSIIHYYLGASYFKLAQRTQAIKEWQKVVNNKMKGANPEYVKRAEEGLSKIES